MFIYSTDPIALYNLTLIHQVVTQEERRLSANNMTADQPEPGHHVRSADEEPSASNLTVIHRDEKKSSNRITRFLILA